MEVHRAAVTLAIIPDTTAATLAAVIPATAATQAAATQAATPAATTAAAATRKLSKPCQWRRPSPPTKRK